MGEQKIKILFKHNKHSQFSFLTSVPEGFKRVGVRKEKAGGLKTKQSRWSVFLSVVSMKQLLIWCSFGHRTRRWNPKMQPYIFAERKEFISSIQNLKGIDEVTIS